MILENRPDRRVRACGRLLHPPRTRQGRGFKPITETQARPPDMDTLLFDSGMAWEGRQRGIITGWLRFCFASPSLLVRLSFATAIYFYITPSLMYIYRKICHGPE